MVYWCWPAHTVRIGQMECDAMTVDRISEALKPTLTALMPALILIGKHGRDPKVIETKFVTKTAGLLALAAQGFQQEGGRMPESHLKMGMLLFAGMDEGTFRDFLKLLLKLGLVEHTPEHELIWRGTPQDVEDLELIAGPEPTEPITVGGPVI